MSYPTVGEMQTAYAALQYYTSDEQKAAVQGFIDDARNVVLGLLSVRYSNSIPAWTGASGTPPIVYTWVKRLAYSLFQNKPVVGQAGPNQVADNEYKHVLDEIKYLLDTPLPLVGFDGVPIDWLPASDYPPGGTSAVLLRTVVPIHSMEDSSRSLVIPPERRNVNLRTRNGWR